jgi:hypothetical protein
LSATAILAQVADGGGDLTGPRGHESPENLFYLSHKQYSKEEMKMVFGLRGKTVIVVGGNSNLYYLDPDLLMIYLPNLRQVRRMTPTETQFTFLNIKRSQRKFLSF